jgi:large subunit ribosomal protein L4
MELTVYKIDGSKTSKTVTLNEDVFAIEPNDHAIYLDVKQYLANQRQGTAKVKSRNEVKGSTRKLRRQKGTGFARVGDIKSPLLRGGGRIHGPQPRDYRFKVNKKVKRLARKSALSYKVKSENLLVLEDFSFDAIKTKSYLAFLKSFNLDGKKSLLVIPEVDQTIVLSSRNIQRAEVAVASDLNTYRILHADQLLVLESSIGQIEETLLK